VSLIGVGNFQAINPVPQGSQQIEFGEFGVEGEAIALV
jgi:hypothetical protein